MTSTLSPKMVRFGLIGAGARLRTVLHTLLKNAEEGQFKVVSVYDPALESRNALRKELGYEFEHASSETGVTDHPEVDWVFIGSWNCHHARQAVAALDAGKNVFCEKPLAITFEDCLAIRDAAARNKGVFAFGLVLRYAPHYSKIREILDGGVLGKIISFEFNETLDFNHGGYIFGDWRRLASRAGSHVLEKCCHDLDLANWLSNSLPIRVASFGGRNFFLPENAGRIQEIGADEKGHPAYRGWITVEEHVNPFLSDASIYDNQVAILQYANGTRATFHTNCNAGIPERRLYMLGSQGAMRADLITGTIEISRIGWNAKIEQIDSGARGGHGGADEFMAKALIRTMLHGETPLASVKEGICSAVAAFAIDQSVTEGRVVDLMPMWQKAGIDPATAMR